MKSDPSEILKAALQLPIEGRAALTDSLLESLDQEVDESAELEWRREIDRRLAELDSHSVSPLPWSDVRSRLIATLRNER